MKHVKLKEIEEGKIVAILSYFLVGLSQIINLGLLVLSVMGIISVINGTKKELPWIELITKKLTF